MRAGALVWIRYRSAIPTQINVLTLTAYYFNLFALPNAIVAVSLLLWGSLLRWREGESATGTWAWGVAIAATTWQAGFAVAYCSLTPAIALQWIVISQIGVIFIAPTLYELLRRLLGLVGWRNRLSPWLWTASLGFLYMLLSTNAYMGPPYGYWWGYYTQYRIGGTLLAAYLCSVLLFLFVECWRTWRLSPRGSMRRHRARVLLLGFGVAFTAALDFLACWGLPVYPFGYLMVAFMVVTIGYAAWRYRMVAVTSQAAAEHVLKTLPDGVLVLDDLGSIALANSRAALLLGFDREELLGKTVDKVLPVAGAVALSLSKGRSQGPAHSEIELSVGNGDRRVINVIVNTMRDAYGETPLTVLVLQDVTRYRDAVDRIRELVYFDQATGLPNRRHLTDKLGQALELSVQGQSVAVCGIRLEHFRHLADHSAAYLSDAMLNGIAARLWAFAHSVPQGKVTVARLRGYEFAVLFERADSIGQATTELNRLYKMLREPMMIGNRRLHPVLWLGVSLYPNDGDNVNALMDRAAAAVDQAAEAGDEHVHFYNAQANTAALHSLMLSAKIARAIETDEMCLYFQPIINTATGAIECAEALVRWDDPLRGLCSPSEFIPVAEQSELIVALDHWVFEKACAHALQWQGQALAPVPRIAVNISGAHLASSAGARIAEIIQAILETSGLPPDRLEIEITETRMAGTDRAIVDGLRHLRDLGVRIAVDDFGTGYASLSYLQWFPLDKLKVDRSFVQAIGQDPIKVALLKSILLLASQLDLDVVAEGIETPAQAAFLLRHGCGFMQGNLFSKALPADDFMHLAQTWRMPAEIRLGRKRTEESRKSKALSSAFRKVRGKQTRR
ncbi:MAG TPA: EAL domain-containing protein [Nitrococcus sp.]|nr:EAL domain-containing protein [Nitrococcus sp.]